MKLPMASAEIESIRLAPPPRSTIAVQVHALLRREIITGRFPPRTMLSEQELSNRYHVSRTPVREALIKLAEENLVEIYPQYGSFIAPIRLRDLLDSQFVREALECAAVELAVERITAAQVKELKLVLERQRRLHRAGNRENFFAADEQMHALIMKIAGRANAWRHVENAKAQMDRVRHLIMRNPQKLMSIIVEHEAIVDRIAHRDVAGAQQAMRNHLRGLFHSVEVLTEENAGYFGDDAFGGGDPRLRFARAPGRPASERTRRGTSKSKPEGGTTDNDT